MSGLAADEAKARDDKGRSSRYIAIAPTHRASPKK